MQHCHECPSQSMIMMVKTTTVEMLTMKLKVLRTSSSSPSHHHHLHSHHHSSCSVVTLEKVRRDLVEAILTCSLFTPYLPSTYFLSKLIFTQTLFLASTSILCPFHSFTRSVGRVSMPAQLPGFQACCNKIHSRGSICQLFPSRTHFHSGPIFVTIVCCFLSKLLFDPFYKAPTCQSLPPFKNSFPCSYSKPTSILILIKS